MSNYIKGSWRVFSRYTACLFIFALFAVPFFKYRTICTVLLLLAMVFLVFSEMNYLAQYEKTPRRNIKHYPMKGLVLGLLGFLPFIIITVVLLFVRFDPDAYLGNGIKIHLATLKHTIQIGILCPLYIPIKLSGESTISYIVSLAAVPLISMAGYMTGYYGFTLKSYFNRQNGNKARSSEKI